MSIHDMILAACGLHAAHVTCYVDWPAPGQPLPPHGSARKVLQWTTTPRDARTREKGANKHHKSKKAGAHETETQPKSH